MYTLIKGDTMNTFKTLDLKSGMYISADTKIDNTFLLLTPQTPITQDLIQALLDWNFTAVISQGSLADKAKTKETNENLKNVVEGLNAAEIIKKSIDEISKNAKSRFDLVKQVYDEYIAFIIKTYTRYATHRELNYQELYDVVKDLCLFVNQNKRYVLQVNPPVDADNKNFLVNHSIRSTILSIVMGIQLKTPLSKLSEIGVACILHEIGMMKFPPQFYMTNKTLTPTERKTMFTHPLLSYEILKGQNFPLNISLAALEHHEKEDGTGYPRKLKGSEISLYAKIIAVACSFEAITAPRHHRDARSSHEAMVKMLKNTGKQYDEKVIKALLCSMSLYPIGSYVSLMDGRIALVADTNPEDPKNPIVQILQETMPNGGKKFAKSGTDDVLITRVLTKPEIEILKNKLANQHT